MSLLTPVTIFTGFLGSGKTTLIANLVGELQARGEKVVYLKNEIGDSSVDTKLLQQHQVPTSELLSGCICCTLVGSFAVALREIKVQYQPDRIIVEASGAADPSAIALTVSSAQEVYRDAVITVIDVVNFTGYKDLSQTAQHQAQFTDIIVFNKVELADDQQKRAVVGYVRELNTKAPIIEALKGSIPAHLVVGIFNASTSNNNTFDTKEGHDHHHDELDTLTLHIPATIREHSLSEWLQSLPKTVFRGKGVLGLAEGTRLVNKVGARTEITSVENLSESSELVLIGFHIEPLREELQKQVDALS